MEEFEDENQLESNGFTITKDELLEAIAKSEGLNYGNKKKVNYTPLFKHPLDVSESRYLHESNLRRILSCKVSSQAITAIGKCDAWVLEEVYMRHGPECLGERNGTTPLHLAVQMNSIDCVMVLVNIGVDLNVPNHLGYTPLYVARLNGFSEIEKLLASHNATLKSSKIVIKPISTILEVTPERRSEVSPPPKSKYSEYHRVINSNHYF
jgi:hypothetical protein